MLSRAYSELTTVSRFDVFYQKWEGIIKSGKSDMDSDLHFFDEHARLKLQKDDEKARSMWCIAPTLSFKTLQHHKHWFVTTSLAIGFHVPCDGRVDERT